MITIKCWRCPKFRVFFNKSGERHETLKAQPICRALNNTLRVIDISGNELLIPTKQDAIYNRIQPDLCCPKIQQARAKGQIFWADFVIYPDGNSEHVMESINF